MLVKIRIKAPDEEYGRVVRFGDFASCQEAGDFADRIKEVIRKTTSEVVAMEITGESDDDF